MDSSKIYETNNGASLDLSIIVPVYNCEKYVRQCLLSIKNQTLDPSRYEVIVVDNHSTDNTLKILEEFENEPNFTIIKREENGGLESSRILGFSNARGNYVGWVDADDFIEPNMFDLMLSKAIDEDLDIVICDYMYESSQPVKKKKWFHEWKGVMDWEFLDNNTHHWNKVTRKALMEKEGYSYIEGKVGDGAFGLIIPFTTKIATISKELYHYRIVSGSMSTNKTNLSRYEDDAIKSEQKSVIAKEKGMSDEWIDYFDNVTLYRDLLAMMVAAKAGNKEAYKKYRKMVNRGGLFSKRNRKFLSKKFSKLQIFVIRWVVMANYLFARICCKFAL